MIIGERNTMGQFAEEDEETGLNHFEARLWDSRLGRWLTIDPAGQYASPYLGMGNNPVNSVDPDGESAEPPLDHDFLNGYIYTDSDGTWKWNGATQVWQGLDGAQDIFGFMQYLNEVTISNYILEITRDTETRLTTTSSFTFRNIDGFFLEPPGPSTTTRNLNRRIPEGTYQLLNYSSNRFPNVYNLYNDQVPMNRRILIHIGNDFTDTSGCLLPGSTRTVNYVSESRTKMNQIRNAINVVGVENVIVKIRDMFHPTININLPLDNSGHLIYF